jgi:heat shock protein HslJ
MKPILILFFAVCFFYSCSSTKQGNNTTVTTETNPSLTETTWRLTELMGQPVTTPAGEKGMFFILKKDGNKVNGFGGCNTFNGSYTLEEAALRITFSQMVSTLMACESMEKENGFMDVFTKADNYTILGKVLSLNKARMAPLARFEAVVMK